MKKNDKKGPSHPNVRWGAPIGGVLATFVLLGITSVVACSDDGSSTPPTPDAGPDANLGDGSVIEDPRPDPSQSSLRSDPAVLAADGTSTATITVTARRRNGDRIVGQAVTLKSSGTGNKLALASGVTDRNGNFSTTMASSSAEVKTLTATLGDISISTQVEFQVAHCSLLLAPNSPVAVATSNNDPFSMVVGDFNADGRQDLGVLGSQVSVLLGKGNGTFEAPIFANPGTSATGLAIGDFNGDGKQDLAFGLGSSNEVGVLLGKGDGTFGDVTTFAAHVVSKWVAAGDFTGDGKIDLAVANSQSSDISVLVGRGDGTFGAPANYPANRPSFIGAINANADGKPDLVAVTGDNTISVLMNNGDGTFTSATTYAVGKTPRTIATTDLNADGKPDLAVANDESGNVSVLLGNGDGTFSAALNYNVGFHPLGIASADFDGNGKIDLVVPNQGRPAGVGLLRGNGDGTFLPMIAYDTGHMPSALSIGDFDGDGKSDVAVSRVNPYTPNPLDNTVVVLLRSGCVP